MTTANTTPDAEMRRTLTKAPERKELNALLEKASRHVMTYEEIRQQRKSFVWGNALDD